MRLGAVSVAMLVLVLGAGTADAGTPLNLRQTAEGYWLSATFGAEDVRALQKRDIKLVVSLTVLDAETVAALDAARISRVRVLFGKTFPRPERFARVADFEPSQVLVHCEWGADRSGVVVAWLLITRAGWEPDHALLAMTMPSERHLEKLSRWLTERGYEVTEEEVEAYGGIYSGLRNGGTGGLKFVHDDYFELVAGMLAAVPAAQSECGGAIDCDRLIAAVKDGVHKGAVGLPRTPRGAATP